ncbi:hypothetical protein [Ferrovibrio sp.]|uniref:hypothetical protein n=1 Tax=Ferrovibrio sp. TaxID=1917215 RepID=UPI0026328D6D|nr:hypothetical protein [Ferrovibrio sp.]
MAAGQDSSAYHAHLRARLRDGASFLGAVEYSPVMAAPGAPLAGAAERENWGIAIENLHYGLLCLMSVEASLVARAPVPLADILQASDRHYCGALFRDLLADFTEHADCRLARLSPGGRITLLSLLLQALRVAYGNLLEQEAARLDPDSMTDLQITLDGLGRRLARHPVA